jgi:hypothetical protein
LILFWLCRGSWRPQSQARHRFLLRQHQTSSEAAAAKASALGILRPLRESLNTSHQRSNPEVVVQGVIHSGVTIRFPGVEATTESDWKGPLRIVAKQIEDRLEIVLIDLRSKSSHPLNCRPWSDPFHAAFQKAMAA